MFGQEEYRVYQKEEEESACPLKPKWLFMTRVATLGGRSGLGGASCRSLVLERDRAGIAVLLYRESGYISRYLTYGLWLTDL